MAEVDSPGPLFDVLAFGQFDEAHLVAWYEQRQQEVSPALAAMIAEAWEAGEAACAASGAMLFNGSLVKLLSSEVRDGVLVLHAGPTDYRTFVGTNMANPHRMGQFGPGHYSNPIGTTATVITSDGYLLYGRRNDRVAYHRGYLHTFGGGLEQKDVRGDGTIDVFASVLRELAEELSIRHQEIQELVCLGLIRDREIHQSELLFDATVSLSREALLGRLDPNDPDQEHVAIEAVADEAGALVGFILSAGLIAPVAVGAVLLHGRRRWGHAWYRRACEAVAAGR